MSQTAHSLRRNLRKRELNDTELRDIVAEVMCHIRIGHILPLDCEALTSAAKRGLISTLPPYMLGEDLGVPYVRGISSWLRGRGSGPFLKPRYFTPYVDEAKSYLEERLSRPGEMIPRQAPLMMMSQHIPDTLYMVDKSGSSVSEFGGHSGHGSRFTSFNCQSEAGCFNDGVSRSCNQLDTASCPGGFDNVMLEDNAGSLSGSSNHMPVIGQLPVIEQRILVLMKQREQELKLHALSNRALVLINNRCDVTHAIQLRVVREFGLPDGACEVLHNTANYVQYPATETTDTATDDMTASYGVTGMVPSSGVLSNLGSNGALASDKDGIYAYPQECRRLEANDSPIPPMPHPSEAYGHYDFEEEVSFCLN